MVPKTSTKAPSKGHQPASPAKKVVVDRIEKPPKPDEEKFKSELAAAEKELEEVKEKAHAIREKLNLAQPHRDPHTQTPTQQRQAALRTEISAIKTKQATFKASRQKVLDQVKAIDSTIKAKLAEQRAARSKIPYKSVEEIDAAIAKLDAKVESGTMKLVDERKALADISQLRKHRKSLANLDGSKGDVDHEKAKITELKSQLGEDPEQRQLSDRYTEISTELEAIKAEQDAVYQNLAHLREEDNKLRKEQNDKWQAKKKLEDEYYTALKAFRNYEKAANDARRERFRAEKEAKDKEYRRQIAAKKMEEASAPAYAAEIVTCEGLIAHFDPTSAEAQAAKTKGSLLKDQGLRATATRVVDTLPKGTKFVREEEVYIVSGKGKKSKKGGASKSAASSATHPSNATEEKGKFQLNHGILVELGKVDVLAPAGWDDVPACVEKLRERLKFYKENSERVTNENIARAQKEIDRLDGKTDKVEEHWVADAVTPEAWPTDDNEAPEETPLPIPSDADDVKATKPEAKTPDLKEGTETKADE